MATVITEKDFENEVLKSDIPVLVDFYADWCGPCKMMAPVVEEISTELSGIAKVFKVDVDNDSNLAAQHKVMSIPTLIIFKDGQVKEVIVGVSPKDVLKDKITSF